MSGTSLSAAVYWKNPNRVYSLKRFFATSKPTTMKYLNQKDAQQLDVDLMNTHAFSIDQLMELAGLSVACASATAFPLNEKQNIHRPLIVCGPGNNGGDGLVAARHLSHFGYTPTILYPKRTEKQLYKNLVTQCEDLGIQFVSETPSASEINEKYGFIVDAIFGFSFKGDIRAPFDAVVKELNCCKVPIVAVDIPSGWDVEKGNTNGQGLTASVLVSLTAPKLCAKHFQGRHFLGGRFVPPKIAEKYSLELPRYPGMSQCVELS